VQHGQDDGVPGAAIVVGVWMALAGLAVFLMWERLCQPATDVTVANRCSHDFPPGTQDAGFSGGV
jgi:hypothetical protein